jgi:membrane protein implicated in regulation of membrane protease activity
MLGIPFAALLFYVLVYLPLAAVTGSLTLAPNSLLEIVVMIAGTNVALVMIGRSVTRQKEARAAREAQLVGRTDVDHW